MSILTQFIIIWWFTWTLFSADGMMSLNFDSGLFTDQALCEQAREDQHAFLERFGFRSAGMHWSIFACESDN